MEARDGEEARQQPWSHGPRLSQQGRVGKTVPRQPLLLALPPDVETVRAEHSRWLYEYERLLIHHREYLALVIGAA